MQFAIRYNRKKKQDPHAGSGRLATRCSGVIYSKDMSERPRGRDSDRPKEKQTQLPEYRKAARFPNELTSNIAYETTRDIIHTEPCELSLYRTALMPAMDWYILVLGQQPSEPLRERIDQALASGETVELPEDVWRAFNARRLEQSGGGPWVERRYLRRRVR